MSKWMFVFCAMIVAVSVGASPSYGQDLKKVNLMMMLSVQAKEGDSYATQIVNENVGEGFVDKFNKIAAKKGLYVNFINFSKDFDPEQEFDIVQVIIKFGSDASFMFNGRKTNAGSEKLSSIMKKLMALLPKIDEVDYDSKEYKELSALMQSMNMEASDEMFEIATDIIAAHH